MSKLPKRLRSARHAAACVIALFCIGGEARADGLLHISDCRIVDDRGPVKAIGVNFVNGFWKFSRDGDRGAYLPYLDALAAAKVPFIRMAFGPWARYQPGTPAPQIGDFVAHRKRYFDRLGIFLADLRARHIGAVVDVFWNVDPYSVFFGEPPSASRNPASRTSAFLDAVLREFGRRFGSDPTIWLVEFTNEGNLQIDFPRARHSRAGLVALNRRLAATLRAAGDRHLFDSGNALPRPAAEHLFEHAGWTPDGHADFLRALAAETAPGIAVASIHVYPEKPAARPWDRGTIFDALPMIVRRSRQACRPVFLGEFGFSGQTPERKSIQQVADSGVQMAAIWGFGRPPSDRYAFGPDRRGMALLAILERHPPN